MSQMVASVSDCSTNLGIGNVVIEKVTSDAPDDARVILMASRQMTSSSRRIANLFNCALNATKP